MKPKLQFPAGFFFAILVVLVGCGLLEPEEKKGAIQIQIGDTVTLSKALETIDLINCILKRGRDTVHDKEYQKQGSQFIINIEDLKPASNYSVLLYGKTTSGEIMCRGYRIPIDIAADDVTHVWITWNRFNPTLICPEDGSVTYDTTPTFDWVDVIGASGYELEVDNSEDFSSPEIKRTGLTFSEYSPSDPLGEGLHYWHVRSQDSKSSWSGWSSMWSLTISTPSINVIAPNGGETWYVGENHNITWTSSGTSGNVKIEYSMNGGSSWVTVTTITTDDGSYTWLIPHSLSTNCYMKITDTDGSPADQSNSAFTIETKIETGTVTDIDGNVYQTIKIGNQWWMVINLKVTRYRNGDEIPNVTENTDWKNLTTDARCTYNNDENNVATYGRLYNWYAVNDNRNIAPAGWHVPTDAEWKTLEMCLDMSQSEADVIGWRGIDEGGKLKEMYTSHWSSPNNGTTNESGFTALPGGYRSDWGYFYELGNQAYFWSATEYYTGYYAWFRMLSYRHLDVYRGYCNNKRYGHSVRCIRD